MSKNTFFEHVNHRTNNVLLFEKSTSSQHLGVSQQMRRKKTGKIQDIIFNKTVQWACE